MKYFSYCPFDHSLKEAYALAQPKLREQAIVFVLPNTIQVKELPKSQKPACVYFDTYLYEVKEDGSMHLIDQKGFN